MNRRWNRILMDENSGGNQGGGGTPLLNDPASGTGEGAAAGGGTGGAGTPGDQSAGANGGGAAGGAGTTDWRAALPADLQANDQLKRYADPTALANAYVNLQRQFSSEKLSIPGKHATDDDWKQVFQKLGVPEDVAKYDVKFDAAAGIPEGTAKEFITEAHKAGVLPKQAQALANWFGKNQVLAADAAKQSLAAERTTQQKALSEEWGTAYSQRLGRAQALVDKFADKGTNDYLTQSGLAADPRFVRFLGTIGEAMFKEGRIVGADASGGGSPRTPGEAKAAADAILGDPKHAYHDKTHPGHLAAVQEVQSYFQQMHPSST